MTNEPIMHYGLRPVVVGPKIRTAANRLIDAAEALLAAYHEKYASPVIGGVRKNAPLQKEVGRLAVVLNDIRTGAIDSVMKASVHD